MNRLSKILGVFALSSVGLFAQYGSYNGTCQIGGANVITPQVSVPLVSSTLVQQSFPGCMVLVKLAGTSTNAALYSTATGTSLANPFQADLITGAFLFFAVTGFYDVQIYGAGIVNPYVIPSVGISLGGGGGGGGSLQLMSCYLSSSCVITSYGNLIWTNPATVPLGITAGLKINISNNIGPTPGLGNVVPLTVRGTNDPPLAGGAGNISSSVWGADIIGGQGAPTYTGNVTIVVSGTTATVTTTVPHNLVAMPLIPYLPDFVTFQGTTNSALNNTVWNVGNTVGLASNIFTFTTLNTTPNGTYSGTMIVSTQIRAIEAEASSGCNSANIQLDAFNGIGCRVNGIEIIAIHPTGLLTTGLTIATASTDAPEYWNHGIDIARVAQIGITFRDIDTRNAFQTAAISDQSYSPIVLQIMAQHTTIIDISGLTGTLTNFLNLGSAGNFNFVNGTGSNVLKFNGVVAQFIGPALSGPGNDALEINTNGAISVMRLATSSTVGVEFGVATNQPLTLMANSADYLTLNTTTGAVDFLAGIRMAFLPTSCSGHPTGTVWNNSNVVSLCP